MCHMWKITIGQKLEGLGLKRVLMFHQSFEVLSKNDEWML